MLLIAFAAAGCSGGFDSAGGTNYVSGDGTITVVPVEDRRVPDPISGETLDGGSMALADFAGKVIVINVWAHWCGPCRAESSLLAEAARHLAGSGVVFVGINTRDPSFDSARAFEETHRIPYPSIYDPGGRNLLSFRGTVTPNAIPSTLVIDQSGRVAASVMGPVTSVRTLIDVVQDVRDSSNQASAGPDQ